MANNSTTAICLAALLLATPASAKDAYFGDQHFNVGYNVCNVLILGKESGEPHNFFRPAAKDGSGIWIDKVGTEFVVGPGIDRIWLVDAGRKDFTFNGRTSEPDMATPVSPGTTFVVPPVSDRQRKECGAGTKEPIS